MRTTKLIGYGFVCLGETLSVVVGVVASHLHDSVTLLTLLDALLIGYFITLGRFTSVKPETFGIMCDSHTW